MDRMSFIDQTNNYIEITIVGQGYDKKEFLEFLKYKKQNGDQMNQWNMDELMIVGDEFIAMKHQMNEEKLLIQNDIELQNKNQVTYPTLNDENKNYQQAQNQQSLIPEYQYPQYENNQQNGQSENIIQQQQQNQIIPQNLDNKEIITETQRYRVYPTQKLQVNQNSYLFTHPNIDVVIQSYSEQPGSLLSKAYILYKIQLLPYGHFIERRFSDFDKLREYLSKNYPDYYVPPIPKKVSSSTKPVTADYRSLALEKFMNIIIKTFWFDNVVDGFFSQNEGDFNKILKSAQKRNFEINQIKTLNGQIECQISPQIDNYFICQQQKLEKQTKTYESIRDISKKIQETQKQLSQEYKLLADQFINLWTMNRTQNEQIPEKVDELCFKNLIQVFNLCSKKQEEIGIIIQKNLSYFYKFQNQFLDSLKEKFDLRQSNRENTVQALQKIDQKIEKKFKEVNESQKQKIQSTPQPDKQQKLNLFPNESKQYESIQDNFGYINNNLYQQIQQTINMNQFQTMQNIKSMFQNIQQQYSIILKELE